jgi:predicted phage terminase large subunit-like protein
MSNLIIPSLNEVEYEICRRSYEEYCAYVHRSMYVRSKFTHYITNLVQQFIEKPTINAYEILCLSVPSQHGKSMSITETLPSWLMGKYPTARIIMASYNEKFASKFLRRNRNKIGEYGKDIFGLNITIDSAEEIENTLGGSIISKGLLGGITGNPGDIIIVDDPIKNRQDADSPTIRETLHEEWLSSIKSRLQPGAKVIVIQTRWHKQDLIGYILETEENVNYVNLPVECLKETDEMGRVYGEMLVPEIKRDRQWWDSFKKGYLTREGTRALNSIYYGNPTNDDGGIFKREWWQLYTLDPTKVNERVKLLPTKFYHLVVSVDATFKDTKKSDFVAIQVWAKIENKCYLLHKVKARLSFTETVRKLKEVIDDYPDYDEILIEDKANGSAIIDVLKRNYRAVIPIEPYGSKEARASAISPMVEAGDVIIHHTHGSLIEESVEFPNSEHDDEVDCMTQALNRLRNVLAQPPRVKDPDVIEYEDELDEILGYQ